MKIKNRIVTKINNICTSDEMAFLYYVGQFQDEKGVIRGIDYKDVIPMINISKNHFYKILYSLERKGIITINYDNNQPYSTWEFQIIDNDFSNGRSSYKEGYLNLNHALLCSSYFIRWTRTEKIIAVNFLRMNQNNRKTLSLSIEKIIDWTSCAIRTVKKSLETLMEVFEISVTNKLVKIDVDKSELAFARDYKTESEKFNAHDLKYELRSKGYVKKNNPIYDEEIIHQTCGLYNQYKTLGYTKVKDIIMLTLHEKAELIPEYINSTLSKIFNAIKKRNKESKQNTGFSFDGIKKNKKNKKKNGFCNYKGRVWDYAKLEKLEQEYLENSVKRLL